MDFNGMNIDELLELRERLDERIAALAESEVAALRGKMDKLQNIIRQQPGAATAHKNPVKQTKPIARKKTGKVPAKYRDPETGKTWSGRGMTPVWLRTYEEQGKDRKQFAV